MFDSKRRVFDCFATRGAPEKRRAAARLPRSKWTITWPIYYSQQAEWSRKKHPGHSSFFWRSGRISQYFRCVWRAALSHVKAIFAKNGQKPQKSEAIFLNQSGTNAGLERLAGRFERFDPSHFLAAICP